MKFKRCFESLSKIQKIEIYLIVLMVYALIFIFYEALLTGIRTDLTHKELIIKTEKSPQVSLNRINHIELLKYIGTLNDKFDISLLDTQVLKNSIELKLEGNFDNIITILKEFQNKFKVHKFEIQNDNDVLFVSVILNTQFIFNNQNNKISHHKTHNPFIKKEEKKIKVYKDIKVTAIIGKEVLIQGQWYKKNDTVSIYNIININKEDIVLFNNVTKITRTQKVEYE